MDEHDRPDPAEIREIMDVIAEAPPVRPGPEVRSRILDHARAAATGQPRAAGPARGWRRVAAVATAVAGAVVVGIAVGYARGPWTSPASPDASRADTPARPALGIGDPFPDFAAPDVRTGRTTSLADFEGDVVLLNVWATWCAPCETEMPSMERLYRELGADGLVVVAVSVDQESSNMVRQWVRERDLSFTILHDREGRFERRFPTLGVPESFLIGRDGRLVSREIGPRVWDSPEYAALVRGLVESDGD